VVCGVGARRPALTARRTPKVTLAWSDPLTPLTAPRALVVTGKLAE
jgi:hypothetical protein